MTHLSANGERSDDLLIGIIEELEEHGVGREEFQLHDFVDPDALCQLIATGTDVTVAFTVHGVHLTVSQDDITVEDRR